MKIQHTLVDGEVKQILPNIFAVIIKNDYNRAMLFCRYQEYYESPFTEIRGENFSLEYFMKLYTNKNNGKYFSYPDDWAGYNVPAHVLLLAERRFDKNKNGYDEIMSDIIHHCIKESFPNPWYLIGVDKIKSTTMNHEIAHGLYYTNPQYKKEMDELVSTIEEKIYHRLKKSLLKIGYADDKKIIDDEIQAFMSTGKLSSWNEKDYSKYSNSFVKIFKKYNKRNV